MQYLVRFLDVAIEATLEARNSADGHLILSLLAVLGIARSRLGVLRLFAIVFRRAPAKGSGPMKLNSTGSSTDACSNPKVHTEVNLDSLASQNRLLVLRDKG